MLNYWTAYQLSILRRILRYRATRKSTELKPVKNRTHQIGRTDILLFSTMRDEYLRLPFFLDHYRSMGVRHFLIVDNNSQDETRDYLCKQRDVSLWTTKESYKQARFGVDWLNALQSRYGHDHWTLVVDPDELLVYPFCDSRPLNALTDWLDAIGARSFSAMLLDMYPKGDLSKISYNIGDNPLKVAPWFDPGSYSISINDRFRNLWIQGGPRARTFFTKAPKKAPALNKIPLVRWNRTNVYVSSTHMLLPRGLNLTYDQGGGEHPSGILLHTKFLNDFERKTKAELVNRQHYAESYEYKAYATDAFGNDDFWCRWSERYINWRQLELLGLMSKGSWA